MDEHTVAVQLNHNFAQTNGVAISKDNEFIHGAVSFGYLVVSRDQPLGRKSSLVHTSGT
jgi:hypothetical protein